MKQPTSSLEMLWEDGMLKGDETTMKDFDFRQGRRLTLMKHHEYRVIKH